jgi:hypothetical protein
MQAVLLRLHRVAGCASGAIKAFPIFNAVLVLPAYDVQRGACSCPQPMHPRQMRPTPQRIRHAPPCLPALQLLAMHVLVLPVPGCLTHGSHMDALH